MRIARPYQSECEKVVFEKLSLGVSKQIVSLSTGLGKTYISALIAKRFNKILFLSHTEELIEQSALAVGSELFGESAMYGYRIEGVLNYARKALEGIFTNTSAQVGVVKQDLFQINRQLTVASIQTMTRRLDKISPNHFDLVIMDETHLAMSQSFNKVLEYFKPQLLLGLTATPERMDGVSLLNLYQEITFERDIKFGIENKYLCEFEAIRVKTSINIDDVRTTAGELNAKDLRKLDTPERNSLVVQKYKEHAIGRQALVFCVDVQHAINLTEEFNKRGIVSEFVVGDEQLCPDRKERIARFKTGVTTVMCNVMVLTAGFDYPECNCIIMARPTKSRTLFMQAIGRGCRLKQGKFKDCLILDIVDATSRHQLINCYELDKNLPTDDRIFWNAEHKARVKNQLAFKNSRSLEKEIDKDTRVNLFRILKVKISRYSTYDEPATPAQLKWISDKGYDTELNTYTKGQCTEIISKLSASAANIAFLKVNGYDVSVGGITIGEYQAAKNEIEKRVSKKDVQSNRFIIKNVR